MHSVRSPKTKIPLSPAQPVCSYSPWLVRFSQQTSLCFAKSKAPYEESQTAALIYSLLLFSIPLSVFSTTKTPPSFFLSLPISICFLIFIQSPIPQFLISHSREVSGKKTKKKTTCIESPIQMFPRQKLPSSWNNSWPEVKIPSSSSNLFVCLF